jgi:6-pyruvoyl-tetrahydropterin synthase
MSADTGVGAIFCAAHRDKQSGVLHGHTYEVIAWFPSGRDARAMQKLLEGVLIGFDHRLLDDVLPDTWAEEIAEAVKRLMHDCVEVQVNRPLERLYARAR